jgi:hypothetical protein
MLLTFWQMAIVPFWGILVFNLNGLPFWGDATLSFRGIACPFLAHSCFQLKWFALLGGMQHSYFGASHVPKTRILTFRKKVLPFWGDAIDEFGQKWPKNAKTFMLMSLFWTFLFST